MVDRKLSKVHMRKGGRKTGNIDEGESKQHGGCVQRSRETYITADIQGPGSVR